jgi:hypothetical protein
MDGPQPLSPTELEFENGHRAIAVHVPAGATGAQILASLGLEPERPVILLLGGADSLDDSVTPRLFQLLGRGAARSAIETGEAEDGTAGKTAWIMDGGTRSGVMQQMGLAIADEGRKAPLIGVAPEAKVLVPGQAPPAGADGRALLDPNHSQFVLTPGSDFGAETDVMFRIIEAVAAPVVTVVAGGGPVTRQDVTQAVRRRLPLIVLEGTGGLADEVVQASRAHSAAAPPQTIVEPRLAEIIEDGRVCVFPKDANARELRQVLLHFLSARPKDALLNEAWREFAVFDRNATTQQKAFHIMQNAVLWMAVATTALALLHKAILNPPSLKDTSLPVLQAWPWLSEARQNLATLNSNGRAPIDWLRWPILALPIVTAVLTTVGNRFRPGNRWIFLRTAAEGIKREIYLYRARAGAYGDNSGSTDTAEETLAARLADITQKLARTEVNRLGLDPEPGEIPPRQVLAEGDDGLSFLVPKQYVASRLQDQLEFYRRKARKLDRQLTLYQIGMFISGAIGSLLVAVGLDLWTALTAGLVATFTGILAYQQTENTLIKYNLSKADLERILDWWTALDSEEKKDQGNIDRLVTATEDALQGELTGWVQQMQDTLANLSQQTAQQTSTPARGQTGNGQPPAQPRAPQPAPAGNAPVGAAPHADAAAAPPGANPHAPPPPVQPPRP